MAKIPYKNGKNSLLKVGSLSTRKIIIEFIKVVKNNI
jgi:hypothetical protein